MKNERPRSKLQGLYPEGNQNTPGPKPEGVQGFEDLGLLESRQRAVSGTDVADGRLLAVAPLGVDRCQDV